MSAPTDLRSAISDLRSSLRHIGVRSGSKGSQKHTTNAAGPVGMRPAGRPAALVAPVRLKPCRFCGSSAATCAEVVTERGTLRWTVHCLNQRCNAHGPTRAAPAAARTAWNESKSERRVRQDWARIAAAEFP